MTLWGESSRTHLKALASVLMDKPQFTRMSLIVPLLLSPSSLSLSFSLLFVAFPSCHIVCLVYGHVLLICSVPLGATVHIGCCVQKTNGSVSSGPGKESQRCRHQTHTHTLTRHAVVHVSVIVLVCHRPPPPSSAAPSRPVDGTL